MVSNRPAHPIEKVAAVVSDAGGRIVGRTRLQKIAYLLEAAGVGDGFEFEYRHYGPFSEGLASAARTATLLDLIDEVEEPTSWGGFYSVYSLKAYASEQVDSVRRTLAKRAAEANSVELELAATAAYLHATGVDDAWGETARRKPDKVGGGRLDRAKALYEELRKLPTPKALPAI